MTSRKRSKSILARFGAATVILVAIFLLGVNIINYGKIIYGIKVANHDFGGEYPAKALEIFNSLGKEFEDQKIVFEEPGKNFKKELALDNLGITIDWAKTIDGAFLAGRERSIIVESLYKAWVMFFKKEIPVEHRIDAEKFDNLFEQKLANQIESPAKNASLIYDFQRENFEVSPPENGKIINRGKMRLDLESKINGFVKEPIFLSMIDDFPEVGVEETEEARAQALAILAKSPFILRDDDEEFPIDKEDLIGLLEFYPKIADLSGNKILGVRPGYEAVKNYIIGLAPGINKKPIDAQFKIQNGKVSTFALSSPGRIVNTEKTVRDFIENIRGKNQETEIIVDIIAPKITENDIENLGITSLISKAVSNFSGSPKNRIHNIRVGTAKFQGILIAPDEEFSFNQNLGEIGPQTGYLPELVIQKDKTAPEYGGGLCQVSTTLFRSAVNAGLEIVERFPHAYPVKYYSPQGFDATIYPPHPDLRFKNNTGNHILIQAKIEGFNLTFEFYGKDDGRNVEILGPYEYDKKPDGSMKARLIQKVYDKDGDLVINKTFYSNYKSPALYPVERNPLE